MFNIGSGELLVILLVALLVLGPTKLPTAVREAGKWMGELRRMSSGFQSEVRRALEDAEAKPPSPPPSRTAVTDEQTALPTPNGSEPSDEGEGAPEDTAEADAAGG